MISFRPAFPEDAEALCELRIEAMRESLERIGRFSPERSRQRFLESFVPSHTTWILWHGEAVGFYALTQHPDHLYLDHLYIHPRHQGNRIGSEVLQTILSRSNESQLPVRLGALRDSDSNRFYQRYGFVKTHEEEWDLYYEYKPGK